MAITTQMRTDVANLYVALFGRAPERDGLGYWVNQIDGGKSIAAVAQEMYNTDPARAYYPTFLTNDEIVERFYTNVLGRTPDADGKAYWAAKLGATGATKGSVIAEMITAVRAYAGTDAAALSSKALFENKVTVGLYYAVDLGGNDVTKAAAVLTGVTSAASSVDAAKTSAATGAGASYALTTSVDNIVGTTGNDTINATNTATSTVLGGLDTVDGGAGTDALNIADTVVAAGADFALPAGFTVKNVESLSITTNGAVGTYAAGSDATAFNVSTISGLTSATFVAAGAGTGTGSEITAADTTDVSLTVAGNNAAEVNGGKAVTIVSGATGTGVTDVQGKGLTSVSVKGGGVVTIDNLGGAAGVTSAVGTTMTAVTLDAVAGATAAVNGAAIASLTVKNQATALATTITNATSTALTVNVDNAGYTAAGVAVAGVTVAAGAAAKTITVNATGSKSNVAVSGAAATTLNITGSADLTLSAPITTATKIDGSAATGGLTLGTLNAATVTVSTGSGKDSLTLSATAKATVDTGAGIDTVTLASAVAAGSTINLGAGNDKLLVGAGSVAASTATAVTTIDAGEGVDTVAAALINAANAAQFKNFENIDVSSATATALDVELMTGSTIAGLTLNGGAGGATVNNVAAGVGLSVSGTNAGTTTIGVKGATVATATADAFAITFAGEAASTATAAAPTTIAGGTVVVNGVESLSVASAGTGFVANTLTLTDSALQTLTLTGDKKLTLAFAGTNGTAVTGATDTVNGVKLIDGSAATGVLVIDTTNVTNVANAGLTVKTGSAKDVITLAQKATVDAGAGDDTITTALAGGTLTGGAGNDKFDVALSIAAAGALTEATSAFKNVITDIAAGDSIKLLAGNTAFTSAKVALGGGVTNLDQALAQATITPADASVTWFQYGTNTYVVANEGTAGFGAGDIVIKLTGLVDLSNSTLDTATDFLTIV